MTPQTETRTGDYDLDDRYDRASFLEPVRRIVVKVGTRILSREDNTLDFDFMESLIAQIAAVRAEGREVALVSSGAVGAGLGSLGVTSRPTDLDMLQAVAAVGQSALMRHYTRLAAPHGISVAQVLMSAHDIRRKRGYQNVQSALQTLFRLGALPIVNENDSVAVEELRYGDNDSLSAHVTNLVNAHLLLILTDIDGLHAGRPDKEQHAPLVRTVYRITPAVERLCGRSTSGKGIGGMRTKVAAAKTLAFSGVPTIIAHGRTATIPRVLAGEPAGTLFLPEVGRMNTSTHHRWLRALTPVGDVIVDDGAAKALLERRVSLLPTGIRQVRGEFGVRDPVRIRTLDGRVIARGIVRYSSHDISKIAGQHSRNIERILGYTNGDEVIHCDNLVPEANGGPTLRLREGRDESAADAR